MGTKIILGSASPRRRELLSQIGIGFTVRVSDKEEVYHSEIPEEIVKELALMKAENVASELTEAEKKDLAVLGADTIVVYGGRILGKPADPEEARQMLTALQGNPHQVYTGTALLIYDSEGKRSVINHAVETKVIVHRMSQEEIRAYIATGEPMDKAGAYGIQGRFAAYIDGIEGDYYNVVGLPVSYIYQELKKSGFAGEL